MSQEPKQISFDELGLKKPLDKMTAKELRELVIDKLPQITGASAKSKEELVKEIKELFGMSDEGEGKTSPYQKQIASLKKEIKGLREEKAKAENNKQRDILRRKINKLKKRTRRLANAV
jgi:hypothetical protein